MRTLSRQQQNSPPFWSIAVLWLAMFLSPTGYFLLLMTADKWQAPAPPEGLIVALFCLIPVVALLVCGRLAWQSQQERRSRVAALVLTVLAMLIQCGVLFVLLVIAITAAIAPAQ